MENEYVQISYKRTERTGWSTLTSIHDNVEAIESGKKIAKEICEQDNYLAFQIIRDGRQLYYWSNPNYIKV